MPKIIHNPSELMNLSREELDELLLDEYKNSALLRELIRVSLLQLKGQTELTEFYKNNKNDTLDKLDDPCPHTRDFSHVRFRNIGLKVMKKINTIQLRCKNVMNIW